MKKVFSAILALFIIVSLCAPCVYAVDTRTVESGIPASGVIYDTASASQIESSWVNLANELLRLLPAGNVADLVANKVLWSALSSAVSAYGIGEIADDGKLEQLATTFKRRYFNAPAFGGYFSVLPEIYGKITGTFNDVQVAYDNTYGVYRLYDNSSGLWLTAENGSFPYYIREESAPTSTSKWKWIPMEEARSNYKLSVSYNSASELLRCGSCANFNLGEDRKYSVELWRKSVSDEEGVYYPIYYLSSPSESAAVSSYVLTFDGKIVNYIGDGVPLAVDTPFEYFDTPNEDNQYEIGDTVTQQIVDLDNFNFNFIDNSETINNAWYDMSDRSYHVSTSYFNFTNNYYYEYNYEINYHINYTSVTYIGQTAEYNETYEFYYQLPDGRSSADLTVEELQALNTQIDVLPYIRSADDTSIRALYHFDGDTLDSSYWSYAGNIEWISGASLTYMDAGAFNGALFLDETAHEFNVQLPSNLGSNDFTLQFRYYQSATIAPVTDSYISIGSNQVLQLSGDAFILSNGVTVPTSIGQWTELCFMRSGNTLYYFYNGVPVGFVNFTGTVSDVLNFTFGSEQQTYKYFDELRLTSKALYAPGGYTPTSVPFDTNLALVLPDSKLPIADAYWDIKSSGTNLLSQYGLDHWINVGENDRLHENTSGVKRPNVSYENFSSWPYSAPCFWYNTVYSVLNTGASGTSISNLGTSSDFAVQIGTSTDGSGTPLYAPSYGLVFPLAYTTKYSWAAGAEVLDSAKTYTLSIVFADSSIESFSFNPHGGGSAVLDGYKISVGSYLTGKASASRYGYAYYLVITPTETDSTGKEFVYMELVEGNSTDLTAEYVESVVAMDKDDLNTPSLAVRTDINITGYQIGGVRPSLPTKGLVWALVEDSMITSLQIYNGQAWEAVDGRIWTGSRWVPYYAYDVILLKDLYDIVESDPSLDYIYTESGFWKWLQSAWAEMMSELRLIRQGVSSGGGDSVTINPDPDDPDFPDSESPSGEKWTIIDLVGGAADAIWTVTSGFVNVCVDGVGGLVSITTNAGSFFEAFDPASDSGIFAIFTYDGEPLLGGGLDGSDS